MSRLYRACFAVVAIAVAGTMVSPVFAQRRSRNSTLTRLQRDSTVETLGLTEEQQEELKKVSTASRPDFKKYLAEMRELEGDAREAKRKQFAEDSAKLREQTGLNALKILTADQRKQFSGMLVKEMGAEALTQGSIVSELGLKEDQITKIKTTLEERRKAVREQGIRATREEREQLSKEWDGKVLAHLSDEQRGKWTSFASVEASSSSAPASTVAGTSPAAASNPAEAKGSGAISFGGAAEGEDGKKEKLTEFSFNSDGASWDDVLKVFAEATELTLDMHDTPPGSFTHLDSNKYTPKKALDIMNGYLLREGYLTVQKDNFLIVWAFDNGIPPSLVPEVTPEQLLQNYSDVDNQLLTVAFKMESGDVEQIAREIDVLLDPYPFIRIAALTASNTLVVTDLSSNLRKVKKLIDAATGKITFKKIAITNIDATEANDLVRAQLGLPAVTQNVSENRSRRSNSTQATDGTNVTVELRTNSLLVSGTQQQLRLIEEIVKAVDVAGPDGPFSRGSRTPYLEVYTMMSSNVMEVGKTIESLMPGKIVNEDGQARKLHIKATQQEHEEIRSLIAKLDQGGGAGGAVAVIPLNSTDVISAAQMLSTMFVKESDGGPVIQSDSINQRLIIRGNPEQIEQIRSVLKD
ncbi:MAG: secretin N-terminal domain-containing protein, partial [Planctomycetaceae bacterium]